ncbi:G patch domain-containing protein 1 homolog [Sitodiplosis mosellana]|uniref:G patch domain-containing protein 1 homolog n=1 Tax=Sitodiplosis mosellana TaxID=263140 RepID=UPI002444BDE8|nr:G patch domain-containing protein 1 homolog [Sitodiplosis mosellana]XP_055317205.1 G patch domain-containing protein 1 homolog [Sitodiplosis mosellana]
MASDDEDELCRFGTPLDPIEEDEVPTTKKITLADQIAVDSNGKRRFHGAFTGGFSAGFWNTVGSREGWTPSEFKSSRGEKASQRVQRPSDFMDDEDMGEFGIAPQRIQTTEDFAPSEGRQKNKRKLQLDTAQGPIPGAPVLELVLESCRDRAAVRLLKRMDKRYAAALSKKPKKPEEPPVTESEDETMETKEANKPDETSEAASQEKVYKCDMGPMRRPRRDSEGSSSDDEELVFDEDEFDAIFKNFKINRFGLDYKGLDKGNFFATVGSEVPIIQNNFNSLSSFTMVDQNKKKVTIRGQAFGVGAFEEDDDDIYGRDDMSKYDFRLENKIESGSSKSSRYKERGFISGFSDASSVSRIASKYVFKVPLPFGFEPRNWMKRKSRFGPEVAGSSSSSIKGPADKVIGRHDLTPDQRGELLGDKTAKKDTVSDIDAKLKAAGLKTMNFTSGGIENKSDDGPKPTTSDDLSAKIEENLTKIRNKSFVVPESIPQIFDRFTASNDSKPLSELDPSETTKIKEVPAAPVVPKEVKKVIRTRSTWVPCQLLCYKMNMETNVGTNPEKGKTFSLFECIASTESARRNRLEFTNVRQDDSEWSELKKIEEKSVERANQAKLIQNELTNKIVSKELPALVVERKPLGGAPEPGAKIEIKPEPPVAKRNKPKTELEMKIIDAQHEHPSKKKDIFKAIFDSDTENSEGDEEKEESSGMSTVPKPPTINADVMATLTRPSTSSGAIYAQLPDEAFKPKSAREINILRNTSPPRGIFSGLTKKMEPPAKIDSAENKSSESIEDKEEDSNAYGPTLPPSKPSSSHNGKSDISTASRDNPNALASISLGKTKVIYEEKWIEKSEEKEKKSKKEKKHKKDRDRHKSKKQKKEKHKKKKR